METKFVLDVFLLLNFCFCLLKKDSEIGFSKAMSNKWIRLDKSHEGGARIFRTVRSTVPISNYILCLLICKVFEVTFYSQVDSIQDQVRDKLLAVKKGDCTQLEEKDKNELKKRKLLSEV